MKECSRCGRAQDDSNEACEVCGGQFFYIILPMLHRGNT